MNPLSLILRSAAELLETKRAFCCCGALNILASQAYSNEDWVLFHRIADAQSLFRATYYPEHKAQYRHHPFTPSFWFGEPYTSAMNSPRRIFALLFLAEAIEQGLITP